MSTLRKKRYCIVIMQHVGNRKDLWRVFSNKAKVFAWLSKFPLVTYGHNMKQLKTLATLHHHMKQSSTFEVTIQDSNKPVTYSIIHIEVE